MKDEEAEENQEPKRSTKQKKKNKKKTRILTQAPVPRLARPESSEIAIPSRGRDRGIPKLAIPSGHSSLGDRVPISMIIESSRATSRGRAKGLGVSRGAKADRGQRSLDASSSILAEIRAVLAVDASVNVIIVRGPGGVVDAVAEVVAQEGQAREGRVQEEVGRDSAAQLVVVELAGGGGRRRSRRFVSRVLIIGARFKCIGV